MAGLVRPRDHLVLWVNAKDREHEVPAYMAHLPKAPYRGQAFIGWAVNGALGRASGSQDVAKIRISETASTSSLPARFSAPGGASLRA
jgi:hypothetical protein